jgi:methylenetetrahydrofolate reductase (NADPH)
MDNVQAKSGESTAGGLKSAIADFVSGYSIESTTHDLDRVQDYPDYIPAGTCVYIAHVPGASLSDIAEMAERLLRQGYEPVPHIVARRQAGRAGLDAALAEMQQRGVHHVLVVAGDLPKPEGEFEGAMDVLNTGLLEKHGIRTLGISGHPEGNANISDEVLNRALDEKARFAAASSLDVHIVTQFGFDTTALPRWEEATTARGITLPIHVGMAGPTSLKRLINMGVRCGIGASLRMLTRRTADMANMLKVTGPDKQIAAYAKYVSENPGSRVTRTHFFALGGVEKTARWANAVTEGRFSLREDGTGFEVDV